MLLEEMRRVVASYEYKAEWWRECWDGEGCKWPSMNHTEGACVYVDAPQPRQHAVKCA